MSIMTKAQYVAAIEELELTYFGAGRVVGISGRQAQRIAHGRCPVPDPVALLLMLLLEVPQRQREKFLQRRLT